LNGGKGTGPSFRRYQGEKKGRGGRKSPILSEREKKKHVDTPIKEKALKGRPLTFLWGRIGSPEKKKRSVPSKGSIYYSGRRKGRRRGRSLKKRTRSISSRRRMKRGDT